MQKCDQLLVEIRENKNTMVKHKFFSLNLILYLTSFTPETEIKLLMMLKYKSDEGPS